MKNWKMKLNFEEKTKLRFDIRNFGKTSQQRMFFRWYYGPVNGKSKEIVKRNHPYPLKVNLMAEKNSIRP